MTDGNSLSPVTKAVLDAIDDVRWDWGNMCEASADVIAVATLRALANYGINEKNILSIADELESEIRQLKGE